MIVTNFKANKKNKVKRKPITFQKTKKMRFNSFGLIYINNIFKKKLTDFIDNDSQRLRYNVKCKKELK